MAASTHSATADTQVDGQTNSQPPSSTPSSHDLTTEEKGQPLASVRPIHSWKWLLACFAIYITAFLYGLDTTIAADVQPDIVSSLGQIEKLAWIGAGFPLGSVAVILPVGFAYGLFELKLLYISSIILFEIGSAVCGAAPTMDAMIIGRIIAGAGGSGMYLGVLTFIATFTTRREQSLYNAICGFAWGLGAVLGPLIGGGFGVSSATWRWAFYINLVIAAVLAPVFVFFLPRHQPAPTVSAGEKLRKMDWLGTVLIAATYTLFTIGFTFGGAQWPWADYRFIITIVFFGVVLIAFVVTQYFTVLTDKQWRIFPGQFLRSPSMILLFLGTAMAASTLFVGAYFIPLFFQFARGDSAIMAAVRLLPFIVVAVVFCLVNGALMPVFEFYMPWYVVSGVFLLIGGGLMYTIDATTSPSQIYGYSVLVAIGSGVTIQAGYSVACALAKPEEIPAAIGFINVAQIGSIVVSLVTAGTIFQNLAHSNLQQALAGKGFSEQDLHDALAGTQSAVFARGSEEVRALAVDAIVRAMDRVFLLIVAAGAVMLVSSVFMKREKLFMAAAAGA